jgi:hypothetical protein
MKKQKAHPFRKHGQARAAYELVYRLRHQAIPVSAAEQWAWEIINADFSLKQSEKAKKGRAAAADVLKAKRRRKHIEILLENVVDNKCRQNPGSTRTRGIINDYLRGLGLDADDAQIGKDIGKVIRAKTLR